ncbi:glycosyltransferase [Chryseobacterium sp. SC28]|uniref:glycosyltransferase n=1 Tax=Chryseobacterium sp. SC28 TaxID=2268028 RepID=UPI000F655A64|nr:glycosyltransferase [Chryseobacterium sp. SC28]RRQ45858.1 glycosyltransferase [Chryseobacterium sp. SC28]
MRVLQVIDSLPTGGGARFVVNLALALSQKNIETDVLLLDGAETSFYKELQTSFSGKIISLTTGKRWDIRNIFRIVPYLKTYDIVHVHIFPASYFVALANIFTRNASPIIFTEHNSQNRRAVHFLFRYIEKLVYAQFKKIVCLTPAVQKFVTDHLDTDPSKLVVIENGIDIQKIVATKAYDKKDFGFGASQKLILMSARFETQKDHETLIKALALLPERFCLIFAGEGSLLNYYKKMVENFQLTSRVTFLGNRTDIFKIMKMCDFNVLSSHFEGLSLSAIEGLAAGRPFIASNVAGLDFIKDAGVLFRKGDEKELASIIKTLAEDDILYKKTAEKCLERAYEYDIKYMIDKYVALYNDLT